MEQEATKLVEVLQGHRDVGLNGNGGGNSSAAAGQAAEKRTPRRAPAAAKGN